MTPLRLERTPGEVILKELIRPLNVVMGGMAVASRPGLGHITLRLIGGIHLRPLHDLADIVEKTPQKKMLKMGVHVPASLIEDRRITLLYSNYQHNAK